MRRALILLCLLLLVPAAQAANPKHVETRAPHSFNAHLLLWTSFDGVDPSALFWCNVYYQPVEDEYPYGYGQIAGVSPDGVAVCVFELSFLTQHEEGTLTVWASATYLGDVIETETGPATVTLTVP